ncbi:MAG: hypothetical protein JNJ54_27005 [Myxococcaceae bacterium]|nr:hypothetical protein [Myxococcaceae bacterium]
MSATCGRHAGVLAVDVCERCGRFVCGDCAVLRDERTWCTECAAVPHEASARATVSLLLGLGGFLCCGPLSIAAIAVGRVEERAISRHAAPAAGLRRARWGVRLGLIQLSVAGLSLAAVVLWRLLRAG